MRVELLTELLVGTTLVAAAGWALAARSHARRRRSEEIHRRHRELSLDLICTASFDGHFVELSPSWNRVLGYDLSELRERPFVDGLAGADIPISGRIVALADVFDALTHHRPYKPAWSVADSLVELERLRGMQFDPDLLDAFAQLDPEPLVGRPDERRHLSAVVDPGLSRAV